MKKPFDFSPDPSQKMNRTFDIDDDDDKDSYEIVDEIEDSEKSESEEEISFLSILRREAKEKEKQSETLTDTQIMMQSQVDDRTAEVRKVQCETKVETTVKITKTYFYMDSNGKRIHVRTEKPQIHKMESVTENYETEPIPEPIEESILTNQEEKSQMGVVRKKRKRVESSSSESIIETQLGIGTTSIILSLKSSQLKSTKAQFS